MSSVLTKLSFWNGIFPSSFKVSKVWKISNSVSACVQVPSKVHDCGKRLQGLLVYLGSYNFFFHVNCERLYYSPYFFLSTYNCSLKILSSETYQIPQICLHAYIVDGILIDSVNWNYHIYVFESWSLYFLEIEDWVVNITILLIQK